MANRVLAVAAHPDDIEFVMSGTMMRLREAGYDLHYMNIANGCCGSAETDAAATWRPYFKGPFTVVQTPDPHVGDDSVEQAREVILRHLTDLGDS